MLLEPAVDNAVVECIEEKVLTDILIKNRAEVVNVVLTEYNEKLHFDNLRADGKAEGTAEALLCLLEELGPVSPYLKKKIMAETNLETLGVWLKTAIKSTTIGAFERCIKGEET